MQRKLLFLSILFFLCQPAIAQNALLQGWYWEYPKTDIGAHWADTMQLRAPDLSNNGFAHVWLPPLSRSSSIPNNSSNGYNIKDLFDMGEYGLGPTGFGTRAELNSTINTFNNWRINTVADMIYNHRDGGFAEDNAAVEGWVENFNVSNCVYPSDRFRCYLPLGGASGNGAGDYYLKISSQTGAAGFYGKPYKMYVTTNRNNAYQGSSSETEPNDGCDCNCAEQPNTLPLNTDLSATLDSDGCLTDEFKISLAANDFFSAGDTLWIYLSNQNGDYSDHRIYGIWNAAAATDVVAQLKYQTYTDFSHVASGRGAMNYTCFKPNGNPTNLCGDRDFPLFFYDYDHSVPATRDTLAAWTRWAYQQVGIKGMRIDAVKHFEPSFMGYLFNYLHANGINTGLVVGENINDANSINTWINDVYANMNAATSAVVKVNAFDFPLRWALKNACDAFGYDARQVFNSGIVAEAGGSPFNVVTFVNNHDYRTSGEAVQNDPILGYAYTLTNNQIGLPSVYYPDYYGNTISYMPNAALKPQIDALLNAHRNFIEGATSIDYLSRFSTPYGSNYIEGQPNTTLLYQIYNTPTGNDVVVAINFAGTALRLDHVVNTGTGGLGTGDTLVDVLGRSNFPYAVVNGSNQMYIELPPRSYSVWVRCNNPSAPDCVPTAGAIFKGKIYLEGAYNTDSYMRPTLFNNNLLPKNQPYTAAPFNYNGTENIPAVRNLPPNTIDWVLLEARSTSDTAVVSRRAALVRADGTIMDEWGNTSVRMPNLTTGSYYISIKHRNHLPLLSNNPIALPNAIPFDFSAVANIEGGATQAVLLSPNLYAMPAGDAALKGTITFADYNAYRQAIGGINSYHPADLNLDGNISTDDFNLYRQNAGRLAIPALR